MRKLQGEQQTSSLRSEETGVLADRRESWLPRATRAAFSERERGGGQSERQQPNLWSRSWGMSPAATGVLMERFENNSRAARHTACPWGKEPA